MTDEMMSLRTLRGKGTDVSEMVGFGARLARSTAPVASSPGSSAGYRQRYRTPAQISQTSPRVLGRHGAAKFKPRYGGKPLLCKRIEG